MNQSAEKTRLERYRRIRDIVLDIDFEVDAAVVDGVHDRETLRHLGFVKPIFTRSKYAYVELADRIARRYSRVAVLTDFDDEGKVANEKISKILKERNVKVCKSCRKTLEDLLKDEKITTIEGIYGLLI